MVRFLWKLFTALCVLTVLGLIGILGYLNFTGKLNIPKIRELLWGKKEEKKEEEKKPEPEVIKEIDPKLAYEKLYKIGKQKEIEQDAMDAILTMKMKLIADEREKLREDEQNIKKEMEKLEQMKREITGKPGTRKIAMKRTVDVELLRGLDASSIVEIMKDWNVELIGETLAKIKAISVTKAREIIEAMRASPDYTKKDEAGLSKLDQILFYSSPERK